MELILYYLKVWVTLSSVFLFLRGGLTTIVTNEFHDLRALDIQTICWLVCQSFRDFSLRDAIELKKKQEQMAIDLNYNCSQRDRVRSKSMSLINELKRKLTLTGLSHTQAENSFWNHKFEAAAMPAMHCNVGVNFRAACFFRPSGIVYEESYENLAERDMTG